MDRDDQTAEESLRAQLVQADTRLASLGPALRQLLGQDCPSLFSDEIMARMRGMLRSLARQLLFALALDRQDAQPARFVNERTEALEQLLRGCAPLLGHLHALAVEWRLTHRLQVSHALDPVLSPLLQELIGSQDPVVAKAAMATLAAQARFCQQQQRMEAPLAELPGDLFHSALLALRNLAEAEDADDCSSACQRLRRSYDERQSRIGWLARITTSLQNLGARAFSLDQAGVALFLSAMALGTGQERDLIVLASQEGQEARLALTLQQIGLTARQIEEQFLILHPGTALPERLADLPDGRAGSLLAAGRSHLVE